MSDNWCHTCGEDVGNESHYHCAGCGKVTGMMGCGVVDGKPACQKKCKSCNGFGYTKGGPNGPWEKLDCETCKGTGKV